MACKASPQTHENEFQEGAIVVEEEGGVRGTVRLSLSVLIEMVELTVQDTPGVAGIKGKRRVAGFFPHLGSGSESTQIKKRERGGIRVRVQGNQLDADVTVLASSAVNIPELGRSIQAKIGAAAERMLGMTAGAINVQVAGIQSGNSTH